MRYEELPARVQEVTIEEECAPDEIRSAECYSCGDTIYWVPTDVDETCEICGMHHGTDGCPVNDWGEPTHYEHVGDPMTLYLTVSGDIETMCGGCYENMDHHPDGSISLVEPDGSTVKTTYMNGVYYNPREWPPYPDVPDEAMELIDEIIQGNRRIRVDGWRSYAAPPGAAGELTKVSSGWHSSMEKSKLSDRINKITQGDLHSGSVPEAWDFPVVVVTTTTSNVCSMGLDVYAPQEHEETVSDYLDVRAQPGHAGVK